MGILVWSLGLIIGIIFAIIIIKMFNKDGKAVTKYDERQKVVRGEAYKYGFFSILITCGILMVLNTQEGILNVLGDTLFFIPIIIGVIVQVTYSIFKDGYVGLNTNMKRFIIFMTLIGLLNLGLGILWIVKGEILVNGVLQSGALNLMCAFMFAVIAIELIIKSIIDKKEV